MKKEWYVVFSKNRDALPFWQDLAIRRSPANFGHVSLYKPVTDTHVIKYDPTPNYLVTEMLELDKPVNEAMQELSASTPVVHIFHQYQASRNWTFYTPSCVTIVKYALGFKSKALTPYRLWSDLVDQGGKIVQPA